MACRKNGLFEGLFCVKPTREEVSEPFLNTSIEWQYPKVTGLEEFKDIPYFCFPDLDTVHLVHAEETINEFHSFILTNKEGGRYYGFCLRCFLHGVSGRYDAVRRVPTVAQEWSLAKLFVEKIHQLPFVAAPAAHESLTTENRKSQLTQTFTIDMGKNSTVSPLVLKIPGYAQGGQLYQESAILPLLELLGVDKLMLLICAMLCEHRVLFVSDSTSVAANGINAAIALLHPFQWQHILISVLPAKLSEYATAPVPYLIGLRRDNYNKIKKTALEGVVFVDMDSGDLHIPTNANGGHVLKDFVGDSGTTLGAMKAGATALASMFKSKRGSAAVSTSNSSSSTSDKDSNGPKDIAGYLIAELKHLLAAKPTGYLNKVVSSTFGGDGDEPSHSPRSVKESPGGCPRPTAKVDASLNIAKTASEQVHAQWEPKAEKQIRELFHIFYLYLFGELPDFAMQSALGRSGFGSASAHAAQQQQPVVVRGSTLFDISGFTSKRQSMGDSKAMADFLQGFYQCQMFDQFCSDIIDHRQKALANPVRAGGASGGIVENDFEIAYGALLSAKLPATISNIFLLIKDGVGKDTRETTSTSYALPEYDIYRSKLHNATLQYISNSSNVSSAPCSYLNMYGQPQLSNADEKLLGTITSDSKAHDIAEKVILTLSMKLEDCTPSCSSQSIFSALGSLNLMGTSGPSTKDGKSDVGPSGGKALSSIRSAAVVQGIRALECWQELLVRELNTFLSLSLGIIPSLRLILAWGSPVTTAPVPSPSIHVAALRVCAKKMISLLLDHSLLQQHCRLSRRLARVQSTHVNTSKAADVPDKTDSTEAVSSPSKRRNELIHPLESRRCSAKLNVFTHTFQQFHTQFSPKSPAVSKTSTSQMMTSMEKAMDNNSAFTDVPFTDGSFSTFEASTTSPNAGTSLVDAFSGWGETPADTGNFEGFSSFGGSASAEDDQGPVDQSVFDSAVVATTDPFASFSAAAGAYDSSTPVPEAEDPFASFGGSGGGEQSQGLSTPIPSAAVDVPHTPAEDDPFSSFRASPPPPSWEKNTDPSPVSWDTFGDNTGAGPEANAFAAFESPSGMGAAATATASGFDAFGAADADATGAFDAFGPSTGAAPRRTSVIKDNGSHDQFPTSVFTTTADGKIGNSLNTMMPATSASGSQWSTGLNTRPAPVSQRPVVNMMYQSREVNSIQGGNKATPSKGDPFADLGFPGGGSTKGK